MNNQNNGSYHKCHSRFTALTAVFCLIAGACTVPEELSEVSIEEEADRQEVFNYNEIVDDGNGVVHTFVADDMVVSVKVTPADSKLRLIYSIETDVERYETFVEYEIKDDQFVLSDSDNAVASSRELQRRLAGTEIERYLRNGDFDLTAGIEELDLVTFRDSCAGLWFVMVGACGATIAAGAVTLLYAPPAVIYGATAFSAACMTAFGAWAYCKKQNS